MLKRFRASSKLSNYSVDVDAEDIEQAKFIVAQKFGLKRFPASRYEIREIGDNE